MPSDAGLLFQVTFSLVLRLKPVKPSDRALLIVAAIILPPPHLLAPQRCYRIEASPGALICRPGDRTIIKTDNGDERTIVTTVAVAAI